MDDQPQLFETREQLMERLRGLLGLDQPAPRRNVVWDACVAALGWAPEPGDEHAAKRMGKLVRDLTAASASPGQIAERAGRYRQTYPQAALTPEAFAKHWSSLQGPRSSSRMALEDEIAIAEEPHASPDQRASWARQAAADFQRLQQQGPDQP